MRWAGLFYRHVNLPALKKKLMQSSTLTQTFDFVRGLLHCAPGYTGINFANFTQRPLTVRLNCSVSMKPIQLPLGVRLRDDATFINYYPGANAAALGYVERLCEADAGWTESLIYLWGKHGVGRTHLLQAACLRFEQMGEPAVYLPLAELLDRGIEILDNLEQYELVCLDDLQAVAGRADWEEALFHLFNRLRDSGRRLLIAASTSPRELPIKLADLKSRLTLALVFQILRSDEMLLYQVLVAAQRALRGTQLRRVLILFRLHQFFSTLLS